MAVAIFTSRSNSQDFEERRVLLTESVKIGRSVAKLKSASNNLIFDCKVLSRNHAIVWYEGGKFFLQDTKSSNGTFINNVRLSKGAEESDAKEIFSGDIVQFGVEVVENSKKGAVTHGCIIATLTLFTPDGNEAMRVSTSQVGTTNSQSYNLWQLAQYIQETSHRQEVLSNKFMSLQQIFNDAQSSVSETFESIIQEDKLLTRLETLENHLDIVTKNCTEDELKQEITRLHEDKNKYEMAAKEGLRRVTEDKLKAIERITILEKSYNNAEDECSHYQTLYAKAQKQLEDLSTQYGQRLDEMNDLRNQLTQMSGEKADAKEAVAKASKKELEYISRLESMQAECDFRKEQLLAMRAQMDKRKDSAKGSSESDRKSLNGDSEELCSVEETIQTLKDKLHGLREESKSKEDRVNEINGKVNNYEQNDEDNDGELAILKNELVEYEKELEHLRVEIDQTEEQLMCCHLRAVDDLDKEDDASNSLIVNEDDIQENISNHVQGLNEGTNYDLDMLDDLEAELQNVKNQLCSFNGQNDGTDYSSFLENNVETRQIEVIVLKCMRHIQFIKNEMSNYKELVSSKNYTISALSDSDSGTEEKTIQELREQLQTAESKATEVRQEILTLRDKLVEEQDTAREREETIANLHRQIGGLSRSRLLSEVEKTAEHRAAESAKSTAKHMQQQAAISAEKASKNIVQLKTLQEENKFLLQKVQTLESELKWSKKEKKRLASERERLDVVQSNHANNSTSSSLNEVPEDYGSGDNEDLHRTNESAKGVDNIDEQSSYTKYFLTAMFYLILALIVSLTFRVMGNRKNNNQNSTT
ncbi:sarcolemmal membrane-associated protein-like [Xenia sp. Carnegie-2017]|uniref:sarcolemmal membrane-associated protein-like n=1 Tax=Xenia sp. Carnegie-2017 TaxID=2897299 RepID=UPI001F039971|nr:sarcolemmal membrane-associated protein-like [Xenia sp. Carnegie-2017]